MGHMNGAKRRKSGLRQTERSGRKLRTRQFDAKQMSVNDPQTF
jgi:hypothetical protein